MRKEVPKHRSYVMLARVLQATAAAKGNSNDKWLSAASLDRYLSDINQPPVFGTQYKKDQEGKGSRDVVGFRASDVAIRPPFRAAFLL